MVRFPVAAAFGHGPSSTAWPMSYLTTAGPRADPVTALVWGLILLSIAVSFLIAVLVVWGVLVRRVPGSDEGVASMAVSRPAGGLKWIWIGLVPTVGALVVALIWTIYAIRAVDSPGQSPALTIEVTGHQWWWELRYPGSSPNANFTSANEIHIPVGEPVLIELKAADVIHSFWIPALGGKTDAIPGRTNLTWIQADRPGVYRGQCGEFCGLQHAHMALVVVADPPEAFEAWRQAQLRPAPQAHDTVRAGQALFDAHCGACHTVSGTAAGGIVGPDLTHVMSRSTLAAGMLRNTRAARLGWISNPQALKPGARMPATDLSARELAGVESYLETLR
ncbi:MAG: cytochrome c oxidase subunit II [Caulobacter sp.]|nr:cytochrome c oxidase subunit II [Caulobacter sp.]